MLKYCSMGVLMKCCEVSANSSETVQDRGIVTEED